MVHFSSSSSSSNNSSKQDAVQLQGELRDAASIRIEFYNGIVWFLCYSTAFLLVFADCSELSVKK